MGVYLWKNRLEIIFKVSFGDIKSYVWLYIEECVGEFLNWLVLNVCFYCFRYKISGLGLEI